ncbi:MAG: S9 family peptidase [Zestosphaera sp.]
MSKRLQPNDFEFFTSVSQVSLNPEGRLAAFTATKPSLTSNDYRSWVEVYDVTSGERVFASQGNKDLLPRWSPSGKRLYFLRVSDDMRIHLVEHTLGDGTRTLLTLEKPIKDYRICCDDVAYAIVQDVKGAPDPDLIYTEETQVWHDGAGFITHIITRLYRIDLRSGYMEPLTGPEHNVLNFDVNGECTRGVLALAENKASPLLSRLYLFKPPSLELKQLAGGAEYFVEGISVEGSLAAISAHKMERGLTTHTRLLLIDLDKDDIILYDTPLGKAVGGRIYNDVEGPAFSFTKPRIAGGKVYFTLSDGGRIPLYVWEGGNTYRELMSEESVVLDFDIAGNTVAYTRSDGVTPVELYSLDLNRMSIKKITNYNQWLNQFKLSKPTHFSFVASDGTPVEGWVLRPVERRLDINGKSPAILEIHGGPKNKYGHSFMFEHQLLASQGFYVIYMNPRGSDGYSEDFADIRFRYGERDYEDIMEGINHVLNHEDGIDPERLGVAGISYGGFMTNWIITHTDTFKVAVSEDGISTWLGEYGVADIGFLFVPDQIGGTPFNNREAMERKSPVYYAHNVKTPTLFIHGLNDYRCYLEQALVMHTTLKHLGKKSAIALFKDSSHTFSMTGKPKARLKRYQLILDWFEKHLGVKT